jgi:Fur family ferric uptake transcriptional regulator
VADAHDIAEPGGGTAAVEPVGVTGQPSTWVQRAAQGLAQAGYRRGGARRAILELLGEQECALSAVEIQRELSVRNREVSRASVYRVMEELEQLGFVQRVELGTGVVRFEPARHGPGHHHHLLCDRCGRLQPFADDGLERAIRRVSERLPLRVSEHEIVIHGACERCSQDDRSAAAPVSEGARERARGRRAISRR